MKKMANNQRKVVFCLCLLLLSLYTASSESFIGINLNSNTKPLPSADEIARFLNNTAIGKVRTGFNENVIKALENTDISLTINIAPNEVIPLMAANESYCKSLVDKIIKYDRVHMLLVGEKLLEYGQSIEIYNLVAAMKNLQIFINKAGLSEKIKVSTVIPSSVLTDSDMPSKTAFQHGYFPFIAQLLDFLSRTDSPLLMSMFPYFDYLPKPTRDHANFCMFESNGGRFDTGTNMSYTNLFAFKVDSMRSALNRLGYDDIEIMVGETGWPSNQTETEFGADPAASIRYNENLIDYLRTMDGTPLMPKKVVDTYIYSFFDATLLDGKFPEKMKSCGIVKNDLTWKNDIHFLSCKNHLFC